MTHSISMLKYNSIQFNCNFYFIAIFVNCFAHNSNSSTINFSIHSIVQGWCCLLLLQFIYSTMRKNNNKKKTNQFDRIKEKLAKIKNYVLFCSLCVCVFERASIHHWNQINKTKPKKKKRTKCFYFFFSVVQRSVESTPNCI